MWAQCITILIKQYIRLIVLKIRNFKPHVMMHVDPAISIIKQAIATLQSEVAADPSKYRRLLDSLSAKDRIIYDAQQLLADVARMADEQRAAAQQ